MVADVEVGADRLTTQTRVLLGAFAVLTVLGFVALVPGAGRTDEAFAWTIQPPVTAAFLGIGYLSGTVLVVLARVSGSWAVTRVPVAVIGAFTGLTLLATLVHLDKLHLDATGLPRAAAWFWLVVYVVIPVAIVVVLVRAGRDTALEGPAVPPPLRILLTVQGVVLGVAGAALYLVPDTSGELWPWALTPFTSRVVASWLLAYALGAALLARAGTVLRLRIPAVAYSVFGAGALAVGAAAVAQGETGGRAPAVVGYLVTATAVVGTGLRLVRETGRSGPGRHA